MAVLSSPIQYIIATPPTTKACTAVLFVFSTIHIYLRFTSTTPDTTPLTPYLTLVPGSSFWYPWTFITASFVETNIFEFLLSLIFIPSSLRYFERLWGSLETLKFVAIVLILSNIVAFFLNWLEFLVIGSETFLYNQDYHGQMALQAALLVAFTQLMPEHQIQLFGSITMRMKRIPMIYVTFSTAACLLGFQAPYLLIQLGWLVAWGYLRFYKRTPMDTPGGVDSYGDRSEAFAFLIWFPPFLHYPLGIASTFTYRLALKLKLVRPSSANDIENGYTQVPGSARAEAERRRALALKALDQRLATSATAAAPSSLTHLDDLSRSQGKISRPQPAAVSAANASVPASESAPKEKAQESS